MKRCPECRRDYYDETLLYCLDDGTALVDGPTIAESATAILPAIGFDHEAPTAILSKPSATVERSGFATSASIGDYFIGRIKHHKTLFGIGVLALLWQAGERLCEARQFRLQRRSRGVRNLRPRRRENAAHGRNVLRSQCGY